MLRISSTAVCAAFLLCAGPALAKTRTLLAEGSPFMTFDLPQSWKTSEIERGLEIHSSDGEAYVWIESYTPAQQKTVFAEHDRYFSAQGVKTRGEPTKQEPQVSQGKTIVYLEFDATWKSEPTLLRYALVDPRTRSGRQVIVVYWTSPDASKRFDEDVLTMTETLELAP